MRKVSNIAGRVEITTDDVVVKMRDVSTPDDEQSLALHILMLCSQERWKKVHDKDKRSLFAFKTQ